MKVLDPCSAPGGKATYIGELMDNTGEIYAYDLHQNKTQLIKRNLKRLGLTNIKVGQHDARTLRSIHEEKSFDRILIDEAPVVFLFYDQTAQFSRKNVSGLPRNAINLLSLKKVKKTR